jgi:hypothetical protein
METKADYTFAEGDFTDFITLGGTVNVTVDGQAPSYVEIQAYHPTYGNLGYVSFSSPNENQPWSIAILPFETSTEIRFNVYISPAEGGSGIYKENIATRTVQAQSVSDIEINAAIERITLSGTVTFTNIPDTLQYVDLYSSQVNNGNWFSITLGTISGGTASGTWSITTPAFETPTDVYWRLRAYTRNDGYYYKNIPTSVTVHDQSITDIDLGTISLAPTGYLDLRVGTSDLEYQLRNYVYTSGSGPLSQSSNNSFEIYFYGSFDTCQWIVDGAEKTELDGQSDVQFYVNEYDLGVHYVTLMVTQNGLLGSREFSFTVVE